MAVEFPVSSTVSVVAVMTLAIISTMIHGLWLRLGVVGVVNFELDVTRHAVVSSYDIWCKRNWCS